MLTVVSLLLFVVVASSPAPDESSDIPGAPGGGLGLSTNRPRQTPTNLPGTQPPQIPGGGLGGLGGLGGWGGLGGLAAIAGLGAGVRTGRRREEWDGSEQSTPEAPDESDESSGTFDGDLRAVWELEAGEEVVFLDATDDGWIAVRIGPADADFVAIFVPGTGADLTGTKRNVGRARSIYQAAESELEDGTVAVFYALPFDAPDKILTIPWSPDCACNDDKARAAGPILTEFVKDLNLDDSEVTVIGHSYGSTVVGAAFAFAGLGAYADNPVFLGSPGVLVNRADQLDAPGEVFAGQAALDFINVAGFGAALTWWLPPPLGHPNSLILGLDPTAPEFGATTIPTGGFGHNSYFSSPTTLEALGHIITGKDPWAWRPLARRVQPYPGGRPH